MNISFTSLYQFLNCSEAFALQHILKKQKMARGFESRDGTIKHHLIAQKCSEEYGIPYDGVLKDATFQEVEKARVYLSDFDHTTVIGDSRILGIESSHKISISNDTNIVTKMDLILENPLDGSIEVLDWKMGRLTSDPSDDDQGNFYAQAIMDKYGVDEVKFTKYFVHYRDARSKVYIRSEIDRFSSYIKEIASMMHELSKNPEDAIPCVSRSCSSCTVQHHCSAGSVVSDDPDELHEMLSFFKQRVKDVESSLQSMASENEGVIELLDGSTWAYSSNKSVSLKRGKISKLELCGKLVSDNPRAVIASEGLDIKLDNDLVRFAENEYGVEFVTKNTNRFGFKEAKEIA